MAILKTFTPTASSGSEVVDKAEGTLNYFLRQGAIEQSLGSHAGSPAPLYMFDDVLQNGASYYTAGNSIALSSSAGEPAQTGAASLKITIDGWSSAGLLVPPAILSGSTGIEFWLYRVTASPGRLMIRVADYTTIELNASNQAAWTINDAPGDYLFGNNTWVNVKINLAALSVLPTNIIGIVVDGKGAASDIFYMDEVVFVGGTGAPADTTAPVITITGSNPMFLDHGDVYTEPGASAVDDTDGAIAVVITGSVDAATLGVYTITYTATDAAGNVATATRTVNVQVAGTTQMRIGTNIESVQDWAEPIVVNAAKHMRDFRIASPSGITYDAQGYPSDLGGNTALSYIFTNFDFSLWFTDTYIVMYDGEGTLTIGGATQIDATPNRQVWRMDAGQTLRPLQVSATTVGNHLKNLRIIPMGGVSSNDRSKWVADQAAITDGGTFLDFESNIDNVLICPPAYEYFQQHSSLRMMALNETNWSDVTEWSTRKMLDNMSWSSYDEGDIINNNNGVPVEFQVSISNLVNKDLWVCIPHLATDDYITQMATYIRDNLNAGLKCYVEYTNEAWNTMFSQYMYCYNQGQTAFPAEGNLWYRGWKWYGFRSQQCHDIYTTVFGGTSRLVRVLATQSSYNAVTVQNFSEIDATRIDALATAPYLDIGDQSVYLTLTDVDSVFAALDANWPVIQANINDQKALADSFGCEMVAYEAGQHLVWNSAPDEATEPTPTLILAQEDPRMGVHYTRYLNYWKAVGGGEFSHFTSPGNSWSRYGSWASQPRYMQSDSVKWAALKAYIATI